MYVYLDESGDLGFAPASTSFFTIAFVIVENPSLFKRCVKKVKMKHRIPQDVELKGSSTQQTIKEDLLRRLVKLDMEIHAITVNKASVASRLRTNTNILYNYMVGLSLVERILEEPLDSQVIVEVDKRITSVTSGFNFNDYLKYKIWYEAKRQDIDLHINHLESHRAYAIQGIDVICNSIYRRYSSNNERLFNIIRSKLKGEKRLFFGK
ncbi:MAG: DUF3800 domain-containing protein [Dehalococcoidia bacterium]|jgi:hypothetical protein